METNSTQLSILYQLIDWINSEQLDYSLWTTGHLYSGMSLHDHFGYTFRENTLERNACYLAVYCDDDLLQDLDKFFHDTYTLGAHNYEDKTEYLALFTFNLFN